MCYIILNVGLFQFYSTAVYIICYIKLILRLFLDYNNGFCIMCFCVPNTLPYVLYHIERWTVPVLHYCCLQIDLTFVPGLQQWLLHNVFLCSEPSAICVISLNVGLFQFYSTAVYIICYIKLILRLFLDYSNGFCIMCFCVPNTLPYVLYHIERCTVLVLQYCCLQIDLTFVPGLQQWLLHNVFLCSEHSTICVISYWTLDCSSSTVLLSTLFVISNWSYVCSWITAMVSA